MSGKLTRWAYEKLIAEDIAALPESMPRLEREHIILVLRDSIEQHYGPRSTLGLATPTETADGTGRR